MSNKLKAITTKAKQLYKSGKYAKWTDAIKEASKSLAKTTVKKTKSGLKSLAKKVYESKHLSGVKKKTAKKKTAKKSPVRNYGSHKDTKSHNVRISVVSGALKHDHTTITFYNNLKKEIAQREDVIHDVTVIRKAELIRANGKMWFNKWVRESKKHVKEQKKLLAHIKKSI